MTNTTSFMDEVIWGFPSRTGAIPLRRGDAYILFREEGFTALEADCWAFAAYVPATDEEPMSIETARSLLAGET